MSSSAAETLTSASFAAAVSTSATETAGASAEVSVEVKSTVSLSLSMPDETYVEQAKIDMCAGQANCVATAVVSNTATSRRKLNAGYSVQFVITFTPAANASLSTSALSTGLTASLGGNFTVASNATATTDALLTVTTVGTASDAESLVSSNMTSSIVATAVATNLGIDASLLQVSAPVIMYPPRPPPMSPPSPPRPPPSPPPSPSPSPPPEDQGSGDGELESPPPPPPDTAYTVLFVLTASGTVDAFDQAAYKTSLAAAVSVNADHITLNVTSASVRVESHIFAPSETVKDSVMGVLQPLTGNVTQASELLGVTVESVDTLQANVQTISPPPSPAAPPPKEDDSSNSTVIVVIIIAVVVMIIIIAVVTFVLVRRGSQPLMVDSAKVPLVERVPGSEETTPQAASFARTPALLHHKIG